jgi:hypothetical protein
VDSPGTARVLFFGLARHEWLGKGRELRREGPRAYVDFLGGAGAFDSEYPHFPQERRFSCSAKNVPGPHFGQALWVRVRDSPWTS